MNRRFAAVLVPLLALSLAACGNNTADTGGAAAEVATTPADPKAALQASTSGIKAGNYSFTTSSTDGANVKGILDKASDTASVDIEYAEEAGASLQYRLIAAERFMKMKVDLGESEKEMKEMEAMAASSPEIKKMVDSLKAMQELFSGKHWMLVDTKKLKAEDMQLSIENPDLIGVGPLFDGVVTAERTATGITGTLDVTKIKGEGQLFGESTFKGIDPAKGQALPYEAKLDAEGRLSNLVLDVPKFGDNKAGKWTVDVTGYGAATKQEAPPAAEVKEMPAEAYEMLNADKK